MITKLAFLLFSAAFVNAQTVLTSPPRVCISTSTVSSGVENGKTLCLVKQEGTQFKGKTACESNGMRLYRPNTSPEALSTLVAFGKSRLGGKKNAEVYVDGRRGNKCQVFQGNGKLEYVSCTIGFQPLCEYLGKPKYQCESYNTDFSGLAIYLNAHNDVADPKQCVYKSDIPDSKTSINVDSTVVKENIVVLDIDQATDILFLPLNIAASFPNLNGLYASRNRIATISYQNLQGLTKLRYLKLYNNQITTLDSNVFKDLTGLTRLDIMNNPIASISSDFFSSNLQALDTLYMDPAGCISTESADPAFIKTLPGAVTNTCLPV